MTKRMRREVCPISISNSPRSYVQGLWVPRGRDGRAIS